MRQCGAVVMSLTAWGQIPSPLPISCVTQDELPWLSEPLVSICKMGVIIVLISKSCCKD